MKTIFNTLFITAAAVFAFSCEKPANDNITPSEENLVELTLTVGADTKTQLGGENNTSIIWQENDKLIVFDGTANREFVIKDFEPGKNSAVFTGLALPAEKYYVVHSTAEGSEPVFTLDEGDPYVTGILVANVQKAVKGSYDPAAFASVGIAEVKEGETDLSVQMRNTCSLVKVSLKSSDIKTIEISTPDENKYLTAKCKYIIREYPGIAAQSDRYLSAVLDSESAMEPGDYYIAILPRDLTNLTVTYTKADGSTASVTATGTFNFDRSSIVPLGIDDSALEFPNENEPEEPVVPEEGDPYVTGILVSNVQKAVKGSYDPAAFASVGIAEVKEGETVLSVQMRNTCSLVKVNLKSSDIKTIEISTTDEKKYLTAKCKYTFKEDPVSAAQSERYLSAVLDSESAMEPGDYYIAILPRELTNLTVKYTKTDGSTASVTATGTFNFKRSSIVPLGIDDSALQFKNENEPEEPVVPEELVLTVDCASQPFTENIATSDSEYVKESKTWYLEQDEVQYPFVIDCGTKGYRYVSKSIRLNEGGATPGSIKTPAIENMKLVSVYVNVTNSASDDGKEVYVSTYKNNSAYDNYLGMQAFAKKTEENAVSERTFELNGTSANKSYYVVAKRSKTQIAKLVLTYQSVTK